MKKNKITGKQDIKKKMPYGKKDLWIVLPFFVLLLTGCVLFFALPKKTVSEAERRTLKSAPVLNCESVINGRFFDDLNDWMADHFPFRESFRKIKAEWQTGILKEAENNGFVKRQGSIISLEKQVNEKSLEYAESRLISFYERYLKETSCSLYASLIPDKSVFLESFGYPVMDFTEMEKRYASFIPGAAYIPLKDTLELADYYLTDSHWCQDKLMPAVNRLLNKMLPETGRQDVDIYRDFKEADYKINIFKPFTGVYAEQSAFPYETEEIRYLTAEYLEDASLFSYDTGRYIPVYDTEGCDKRDMYTMFTGGSSGVLKLERHDDLPSEERAAYKNDELIIIRDSFASSIAPLLLKGYRSIILIDLRYVSTEQVKKYVRFTNQDVLFLFSSTLINNSQGLR